MMFSKEQTHFATSVMKSLSLNYMLKLIGTVFFHNTNAVTQYI